MVSFYEVYKETVIDLDSLEFVVSSGYTLNSAAQVLHVSPVTF